MMMMMMMMMTMRQPEIVHLRQSSSSLLQLSHQLLVQFLQVAVLMLNARLIVLQAL